MNDKVIELQGVKKIYKMDGVETHALRGVDLSINKKEFIAIMGPSGSGKSTLLHMVGALDKPTSGKVILDGVDISTLKESDLARLRGKKIGFVFQFYNLHPNLTAFENMSFENRSFENFNVNANLTEIEFTENIAYLKISTDNDTFAVLNLYTIEGDQLIFTRQFTGERPGGLQPPSDWDCPDWNPPSNQERPSDWSPPSDMQRSSEEISYSYRFNEDYTILYISDNPFIKL